jgi:hypothetical protein
VCKRVLLEVGRGACCIPAEICEFLLDGQSAVFEGRARSVAAVTYLVDTLESHDGDCLRVVKGLGVTEGGVGVGGAVVVVGKTEGGNALVGQSESEAASVTPRPSGSSCDPNLRHMRLPH